MEFLLLLLVAGSTSSQVQRLSEISQRSIIELLKKKFVFFFFKPVEKDIQGTLKKWAESSCP